MFLTTSLLSKASFLGSILSKCRPSVASITANFNSTTSTNKTIEEQVGLPPRPKRPLPPYFRFMRDIRAQVAAEHPSASHKEIVSIISKKWSAADLKLKERLTNDYKKDQEAYVETRAKYDAKITDEQHAEIQKKKHELVAAKERSYMRQRIRALGRPKKPVAGYLRYIQQQRTANPRLSSETQSDWHQKVTNCWHALPEEEKQKINKESCVEFEQYRKDLKAWEENMVRTGNADVVRQKNQVITPIVKRRNK